VSVSLRRLYRLVLAVAVICLLPLGPTAAQDGARDRAAAMRFARIGTGPTGGTYFPVGGLIANAISNPPGSRPCDKGGSCGVPGLIAVAQSTHGSVANVEAVAAGQIELALTQADVAYWAYHGSGVFKGRPPMERLRAIGLLYQEAIHLVVRADAAIAGVGDLKGKRVSLGEQGSGTLVDARAILKAFGVREAALSPVFLKPGASADALTAGEIDAFFFVAGAPVTTISPLLDSGTGRLVAIDGPPARALADSYPFLLQGEIAADAYAGVAAVPTITVGAVLVCSADLPNDLVEGITHALWHANNQPLFRGIPGGAQMRLDMATTGLGIPLHPGAATYYAKAGLME
jgi:TRAP transporter TAXI family solute receptor